MSHPSVVLASTSIWRKQLLERLRIPFTCESPGVDERALERPEDTPAETAAVLAHAKAQAVFERLPNSIVIGSDQLVNLDEAILGKPGHRDAAIEQLTRMSGRSHQLITSVAVLAPQGTHAFTDVTRLRMRNLEPQQIARYVDAEQPFDCAGSYMIESAGVSLFESIETDDFSAITGLPLIALTSVLLKLGVEVI